MQSTYLFVIVLVCQALDVTAAFAQQANKQAVKADSAAPADAPAAKKPKARPAAIVLPYPPTLPNGKETVTDTSPDFLKSGANLRPEVTIAKTPPTIDFMFYPGQTYPGKPWSNWGDSLAVDGKYYASIGDHLAPQGNAFVYEYDPATKKMRQLLDLCKLLQLPDGHYSPGKIHSRIDKGDDGWLYFSTHRGSPSVTNDTYHYRGDWVLRANPSTGQAEVVVQAPVPRHCIPTSVLDPQRLIYYGGTAPGSKTEGGIQFFAYDATNKRMLYAGPDGPARYMIFARSTGKVYYTQADGSLVRFDPATPTAPIKIPGQIGIRAATQETPDGLVYAVSNGQGTTEAELYSFNAKTEAIESLGPAAVGGRSYITTLDADPTGRYLYYTPGGAHGGSEYDGTPVVQFDTRTRTKKVLAFLHPFYQEHYGCTLAGTYSSAVDPAGDKLYFTWNTNRGGKVWDCCTLTVIHIPASEREP